MFMTYREKTGGGEEEEQEAERRREGQTGGRTSVRRLSELRQRSVAPKQKQLVQPFGLVGSRWNVPTRHWSQREPWTFSWRPGGGQRIRARKHQEQEVM